MKRGVYINKYSHVNQPKMSYEYKKGRKFKALQKRHMETRQERV